MGVTKLSCFVVELSISFPLFEALFFLSIKICPKNYEFGDVDRKRIILIWMTEGHLQPQICMLFILLY
uniref:Uncharacterized protein n=1 Tax=Cannabis sativa TaxID=3483 RepID=A0A803QTR6_CANSA